MVSVEVSLQYTVYRTVRPGASGVPFVKVVTGVQVSATSQWFPIPSDP